MIQVPGVVPAQAPVRARGLVVSLAQAVVVSPALAAGVVVSPALAAGVVVSPALTAGVVVSPAVAVAVPDSARMQVEQAGLVLPLPRPP
jgi:beta-lactam-binding protein with PASTA domain